MGVGELVVWDLILVGLVVGLSYAKVQLEVGALVPRDPDAPTETETATLRATPTPGGAATPVPAGTPLKTNAERAAEKALARLQEQAASHLRVKRPDLALARYEDAPPSLQGSAAWRAFWPGEQKRLLGLMRERDLYVALRPEVQLAADRGRPAGVKGLLEKIPAGQRDPLAGEETWARAHAGVTGDGGGLQILGFSPDQVRLEGRRCVVDCALGRSTAQTLRSDIDALTKLAQELTERTLETRLELRVVAAGGDVEPRGDDKLLIYQRPDEGLEPLLARARLGAAEWARDRLFGRRVQAGWACDAFCHMLAGAKPVANSARPTLTPEGAARRRLFLYERPRGQGEAVLAVLGSKTHGEAAGVQAWALMHYASFGRGSGAEQILRLALESLERGGGTSLNGAAALGVEQGWLAFLEQR